MVTKSTNIMLSIGVMMMAYYVSGAAVPYKKYMRVLYNETLTYKHYRCYLPLTETYTSPKKITDLAQNTIQRWFYDPYTRACRPFFTGSNYTYTPEDKNYNLPHTKIECETLCGSICLVNHASGRVEMGICMSLEYGGGMPDSCKTILPEAHPRQCPQVYSKCCPRNYQLLIHTEVKSQTATLPLSDDQSQSQNRSIVTVDNVKLWEESILHNSGYFTTA